MIITISDIAQFVASNHEVSEYHQIRAHLAHLMAFVHEWQTGEQLGVNYRMFMHAALSMMVRIPIEDIIERVITLTGGEEAFYPFTFNNTCE